MPAARDLVWGGHPIGHALSSTAAADNMSPAGRVAQEDEPNGSVGASFVQSGSVHVVLRVNARVVAEVLAESWRVYPQEACGLLLGPSGLGATGTVRHFRRIDNAAHSSRIFELDPRGFMKAERFADDNGLEVVGVMHSHTHTAAYPSETDVAEATKPLVPPSWHWLIVSLASGFPELRSFAVAPSPGNFGLDSASGIAEEAVLLTN